MELQLKHILPYLPDLITDVGRVKAISEKSIWIEGRNDWDNAWKISSVKPILLPLDSLTKEIEIGGKKIEIGNTYEIWEGVTVEDWIDENNGFDLGGCPYHMMKKLFEWKIDVFNLIPSGLAIDVTTLETNSYTK